MKKYILLCLWAFLSGCSIPMSPEKFTATTIQTPKLTFNVWEKMAKTNAPIRIYIESNGDPEPDKQTALILAMKDPSANIIYLTRPCQYRDDTICHYHQIWEESRFDEEIVNEMKNALQQIQRFYHPPYIELVGYDDGGTMALLLASRVNGVRRVITIGGILDTTTMNVPLDATGLNPINETDRLQYIPQVHYVGELDTVASLKTAQLFRRRMQNSPLITLKTVSNTRHDDWEKVHFEKYY